MQVVSVAGCTVTWGAHTGQNVLFDDDPAGIADLVEGVVDCIELYCTLPQLTKNTGLQCCEVVAVGCADVIGDGGVAIFVMDEADVRGEFVDQRDEVAGVIVCTVQHMTGVENKSEQLCVDMMEESLYFIGCLDDAGTVMVKRTLQATRSMDGASCLTGDFGSMDEDARMCPSADSTRIGSAYRVRAICVGEDD